MYRLQPLRAVAVGLRGKLMRSMPHVTPKSTSRYTYQFATPPSAGYNEIKNIDCATVILHAKPRVKVRVKNFTLLSQNTPAAAEEWRDKKYAS